MKDLLGKKILGIRTNADHTILAFDTDAGVLAYVAEGDCCSQSWFQHFDGVSFLIGRVVDGYTSIDEGKIKHAAENSDDPRNDDEQVLSYAFDFVTDAGDVRIEMRNASNGYYSGECVRCDEASIQATVPVTEDF